MNGKRNLTSQNHLTLLLFVPQVNVQRQDNGKRDDAGSFTRLTGTTDQGF